MRKLTDTEKNKIRQMVSIYKDHINLTTFPTAIFYKYTKGNNITEESKIAKDYLLQNCKTRDYIETLFLLKLLEDNGLIYIDKPNDTTQKAYVADLNLGTAQEKCFANTILTLPEEIGKTLARHYYSNTYISTSLIAFCDNNFITIEDEELECTRTGLKRSKRANIILLFTLIVTILAQAAITLYYYHFNSQIPNNVEIVNMPNKLQGEKTYNNSDSTFECRKNINIKAEEAQVSLDSTNCDISVKRLQLK